MDDILKVGDTVNWSGGFGTQPPKPSVVENIEIKGKQHGSLSWEVVWNSKKEVVIDLSNGHWCYGFQIKKKEK